MNQPLNEVDQIAAMNQKIMANGEQLPVIQLQDGSRVPTGTVATLLYNIALYNQQPTAQLEDELKLPLPILFKLGLFDLFPPQEWLSETNAGKRFVGHAALAYQQQQAAPSDRRD